jgi:hypothetical protein
VRKHTLISEWNAFSLEALGIRLDEENKRHPLDIPPTEKTSTSTEAVALSTSAS